MTEPGITAQEIERLEVVKDRYISRRHSLVATTVASSAAFSLATLSSSRIPDQVNFWVTVLVLSGLLFILLWGKLARNPLATTIQDLEEKYPNHTDTRQFLDKQNIWKGFQEEKMTLWLAVLLSVLFVCYAGVEHALRAFF